MKKVKEICIKYFPLQIKGLRNALDTPGVCSNYSPKYAPKTFEELKAFREGNAIFTFPNTPIKCPGAPQKIMYIADQYLRKVSSCFSDDNERKFQQGLGVLLCIKTILSLTIFRNPRCSVAHLKQLKTCLRK